LQEHPSVDSINDEKNKARAPIFVTNTAAPTFARACPGFFIGGKTEGPKAESGVGFLGRGQQPPVHQLGVW